MAVISPKSFRNVLGGLPQVMTNAFGFFLPPSFADEKRDLRIQDRVLVGILFLLMIVAGSLVVQNWVIGSKLGIAVGNFGLSFRYWQRIDWGGVFLLHLGVAGWRLRAQRRRLATPLRWQAFAKWSRLLFREIELLGA